MKRNFSGLTLEQAMEMVPARNLLPWKISVPQKTPSANLETNLSGMDSFEMISSEAAKILLIDTLLLEILPRHPNLKVWKAAPLEAETVWGVADYLIAPKRAYIKTPLLCAIEAKRDDFEKGQIQCIAEMTACRDNNKRDGHEINVYGIVSNGQGWVFYQLSTENQILVSGLFTTVDLPTLLGVLDFVCAACAQNAPD